MRTTGGGKVVAGLVDGKNAPPPGTVDLLSRLGQVDISKGPSDLVINTSSELASVLTGR